MNTTSVPRETQFISAHSSHGSSSGGTYAAFADKSISAAANDLAGKGQIESSDIDALVDAMGDSDQLTMREARQFIRWGLENYDKMSPEARKKFDKINELFQKAGSGDLTDGHLAHFKDQNEVVLLDKAGLDDLTAKLDEITGKKAKASAAQTVSGPAPANDGVEKPKPAESKPTTTTTAAADPLPPPSASGADSADAPLRGLNFAHMSWAAILSAIREMLGKKEQEAKEKLGELTQQFGALPANDPKQEDLKGKIADITDFIKQIEEMFTMVSNIAKGQHELAMTLIRNLA